MENDNVTIRRIPANISLDSFSMSFTSTHSDYLSKSSPDLSTICNTEVEELKTEIQSLRNNLESAHREIENLTLEINSLKNQTLEQQNKIINLKRICSGSTEGSPVKVTPKLKEKRKEIHIRTTPKLDRIPALRPQNKEDEFKHNTPKTVSNTLRQENKKNNSKEAKTMTKSTHKSPDVASCIRLKDKIINEKSVHTEFKKSKEPPKIYIYGAQRCINLASQLINSRKNSKFEDYKITSVTQPFAPSEKILNFYKNIEDHPDNYLILSLGENDIDPTKVMIDLTSTLKSLHSIQIIVLSIKHSKYLNENKFNHLLRKSCTYFKNCIFLNSPNSKYDLKQLCKDINYTIDCNYYHKNYIVGKNRPKMLFTQNKTNILKYKKGTIPFYFFNMTSNKRAKTLYNGEDGISLLPKKGTIPYYFSKVKPGNYGKVGDGTFHAAITTPHHTRFFR